MSGARDQAERTVEPWTFRDYDGYWSIEDANGKTIVADSNRRDELDETTIAAKREWQRIVSCVNGCQRINNPEAVANPLIAANAVVGMLENTSWGGMNPDVNALAKAVADTSDGHVLPDVPYDDSNYKRGIAYIDACHDISTAVLEALRREPGDEEGYGAPTTIGQVCKDAKELLEDLMGDLPMSCQALIALASGAEDD